MKAHTATVWSLHVRADAQALVSGSADNDVKFWEFAHKDTTEEIVGALLLHPNENARLTDGCSESSHTVENY